MELSVEPEGPCVLDTHSTNISTCLLHLYFFFKIRFLLTKLLYTHISYNIFLSYHPPQASLHLPAAPGLLMLPIALSVEVSVLHGFCFISDWEVSVSILGCLTVSWYWLCRFVLWFISASVWVLFHFSQQGFAVSSMETSRVFDNIDF